MVLGIWVVDAMVREGRKWALWRASRDIGLVSRLGVFVRRRRDWKDMQLSRVSSKSPEECFGE